MFLNTRSENLIRKLESPQLIRLRAQVKALHLANQKLSIQVCKLEKQLGDADRFICDRDRRLKLGKAHD